MPRWRSRLRSYLTHGGRVGPQHPDFRRVLLLNMSLLVLVAMCGVFAALNLLVLGLPRVAVLDVVAGALALGVMAWYRRSRQLDVAAWATLAIVGLFLLAYVLMVGAGRYSLAWLGVFPGLALFLLGERRGLWATSVLVVASLLALSGPWMHLQPQRFDAVAAFNLLGTFVCLVLQARYNEMARQEVLRGLVHSNRELQRLSNHDRLTGLYNRLKLEHRLAEELARARRHGSPFSVVLIDIDHFKRVNDTHGHAIGDLVLQCLGHVLLRDRRSTDMVGRWGGEEFLILCPETRIDGGLLVAERLRAATQDCPMPEAGRVTLSAGVAEYRAGDCEESLVARADAALYRAKSAGRNRVESDAQDPAPGEAQTEEQRK